MPNLNLSADEVLATTRAVRKRLDFDKPVELSVVRDCLALALQAPTGGNSQSWHFVIVADPVKRQKIAELYRKAFAIYRNMAVSIHARVAEDAGSAAGPKSQTERVMDSAEYLAANLERAPLLLIPCIARRAPGVSTGSEFMQTASLFGSILPALWSFMLAARNRGLGTAWTTGHLMFEREAAAILGIDADAVTQCALTPVAYTKGTNFKPAERKALDEVLHIDHW